MWLFESTNYIFENLIVLMFFNNCCISMGSVGVCLWNTKKPPKIEIFKNRVCVPKHSQTSKYIIKIVFKRLNNIFKHMVRKKKNVLTTFSSFCFIMFFVIFPCFTTRQGKNTQKWKNKGKWQKNIRKQKEEKVVRTIFFFEPCV